MLASSSPFKPASTDLPALRFARSAIRQALKLSLVAFFAWAAPRANAQSVLVVDRTDDNASASACTAAANDCSLRGAITAANAAPGSTVQLGSGLTYTLSLGSADSTPGSLVNASGDLDITSNVTIEGNNSIINANGIDRIFQIESLTSTALNVFINNLTMRNGRTTGSLAHGGGILTRGANLTLNRCEIRDCSAGQGSDADNGGAIAANSILGVTTRLTLSLQKTTLAANQAANGGALLLSGVNGSLSQSTLSGNTASGFQGGGGIYALGDGASASLSNCTVTLNRATYSGDTVGSGGGILVEGTSTFGLSMNSTVLAGNLASNNAATADYSGPAPTSSAFNLVGVYSGTFGTSGKMGTSAAPLSPALGALATPSGGGPRVHTPTNSSPLIDSGLATGLSTDATNSTRIVDLPLRSNAASSDASDIGAVEFQTNGASQGSTALVVNVLDDVNDGACTVGHCSLREAVATANLNTDTTNITFTPGLTGILALTGGQMNLSTNLSITGPSATSGVNLGGGNASRIFQVDQAVNVTLKALTFSKGSASGDYGGAIYNSAGVLTIDSCSFRENSASSGGAIDNFKTLVVQNSTFSGNSALYGGGIDNEVGGILTVRNSTLAANNASIAGGGLYMSGSGTLNLSNSILAANTSNTGPNLGGTVTSGDYNLVQNAAGATLAGTHNIVNISPLFGSLGNNGGPTDTYSLQSGSPAINAGDPAFNGSGQFDQRGTGFARVVGNRVDIGAFEVGPTISIGNASIVEGNTGNGTPESGTQYLTFPVTLSAISSSAVTISYSTSDGTALAGSDYLAVSNGSATIPAGQTTGSISIAVLGDTRFESDETMTLTISNPVGATLGTASASGTIVNDDQKPTLSINNVSVQEGNSGTSVLTFTVSLSTPSNTVTVVPWQTTDGSATSGSDYVAVSNGSLTIAAGQSSATLSVTINGDSTLEADETFNVILGTPVGNATLSARSTGVGTILNDDGAATVPATDVTTRSGNPNGVTVLKSGLQRSRGTGRLVQTVVLQNNTGSTIAGPVYVALDALTGGTLYNVTGTTAATTPSGSPYLTVVNAGNILPMGSTSIYLEFVTTASTVSYNARVLAGPGSP